ncbi:MAG: preprotein translocase subunit SecE [Candidatus Colwellbacteria bacterium]|nr:preprotein translocase subunit SecE [Candidatus Colwellbacteria bacterium]
MFERLSNFFKDLRKEVGRINWPTRGETVRMSLIVIVFSLVVAAFLGALDYLFFNLISKILS